jgi:hypothetical protein
LLHYQLGSYSVLLHYQLSSYRQCIATLLTGQLQCIATLPAKQLQTVYCYITNWAVTVYCYKPHGMQITREQHLSPSVRSAVVQYLAAPPPYQYLLPIHGQWSLRPLSTHAFRFAIMPLICSQDSVNATF